MFMKRKQSLPARPSIPSHDEILQDLRESKDNDVVFKSLVKVLKDQETIDKTPENDEILKLENSVETLTAPIEGTLEPATAFNMAKRLLELCNSLGIAIQDIEEKRNHLLGMKKSLEDDVKNVKETLGEKHRSVATE